MKTTTRDNILYLVIALSLVGGASWWSVWNLGHGRKPWLPSDSQAISFITTGTIFWCAVQARKRAYRQTRFWVAVSVLLALFIPLQLVLIRYLGAKFLLFILLAPLEFRLVLYSMDSLVPSARVPPTADDWVNHQDP